MRVVIIGAGQVGSAIIETLADENADVVAIDLVDSRLQELRDDYDIQTICGSGSNPKILEAASVASADMIVAVTDSDEVNMVASSISAMLAPHTIRVARIREKAFLDNAEILGKNGFKVDHPINPEHVAAKRLAEVITVPIASDVADCGHHLKLVGVRLPQNTPVAGKTFAQLRELAPKLKVIVATRVRAGVSIVPHGTDDIQGDDVLYIIINPDDMHTLAKLFQLTWRVAKRITIAGGTGIGYLLAKNLESCGKAKVKIIEPDATRANKLAEKFAKTLVLQGSPTDESLLLEENIRDCDVFVAALSGEEANVMAALNAKRLGANRVITLTNKTTYIPIIENAGVDAVVSPRSLAIGTILQHVRKGRIKTVIPYGNTGQAEAIVFEAQETSAAVGKPLKNIKFPEGSMVGAIIRGQTSIIPGGDDIIEPGDNVFVFSQKNAIKKLEKLMSVRMDFF